MMFSIQAEISFIVKVTFIYDRKIICTRNFDKKNNWVQCQMKYEGKKNKGENALILTKRKFQSLFYFNAPCSVLKSQGTNYNFVFVLWFTF